MLVTNNNNSINYIEFKCTDIAATKNFYSTVFRWSFSDYGPGYCSFKNSGVAGGFELTQEPISNGVLIVLYHHDLEEIRNQILKASGRLSKDIFSFPGGKRFHFLDPSGNELAVWSE